MRPTWAETDDISQDKFTINMHKQVAYIFELIK